MAAPLLQTKLYIPPPRSERVSRPRLIERLNAGLHHKLTLVSAPAGSGKTTLVSEWVAALGRPVAWLSLDEGDNDLPRFLTYFVAALQAGLQTTAPRGSFAGKIGQGVLRALSSPQLPPTESILTPLLNEIAAHSQSARLVLVLDDYHVIDTKPVDDALTFLLEHLPPAAGPLAGGLHLVMTTREDPQLPLARLRVRGQLTELREADLRFTLSEAARFLNQVMGQSLSAEEIAALENRTEGWIAGLQMAALALHGRADTDRFVRDFTGSHRFVLDYLVEEVLQRQPERVRSFLQQTSILDRLCGPLCDALQFGFDKLPSSSDGTAAARFGGAEPAPDGKAMLEALERSNLFVVPLDDQRQWYRYHHLFADVLHAHLMEEQPNRVPILHQRASEWYEQSGSPPDAVRHALAAGDYERVAGLAERTWQAMDDSFQSTTWLDWVKKLPDELIRTRPVLCTQVAWALWLGGELEASEARLRDAERWLDPAGDPGARPDGSAGDTVATNTRPGQRAPSLSRARMVVVDKEQFRTLPARIALVRAYNAEARGDFSATAKYAELALKLTPEDDHLERAQAAATLGFTHWASGDLEAARRAMADWISSMQKAGNIVFVIASTFALADIMVAQGRLRKAARAYKGSLQLASEHDEHVQRVIAHSYLGLAMLYHEMGDQGAAAQHLLKGRELGEQSTMPDWPCRWALAQAQLEESRGDLEAALDLLDEAKRLYVRNTLPDIRPIEALKARVYLRQGRLAQAQDWVSEQGLSVEDELTYLREFEHITLARVLIARYKSNGADRAILEAIGLLERLLKAAEESRRMGSVIEILVQQALAHQARGSIPLALASLERALVLAEPEGYLRIFVDEGLPMAQLLAQAAAQKRLPDYVGKLRAACTLDPGVQPLIEPLTPREREVLELLVGGCSNPEIAAQLVIAVTTVKTHVKNIYGKLGVANRFQAIARAKELKLL